MIKKNKKGLVLAEALVAVAILVIGVTITSSIIKNAFTANAVSRDYLIAQNLATEAIEVVKSIKETNMLLHPDDQGLCWLDTVPDGVCGPPVFGNTYYGIERTDGYFSLRKFDAEPSVAQNQSGLVLDENGYRNYKEEDRSDPLFFRHIYFTQVNDANATFDVVVRWKDGASLRTLTRTYTISKI